jgi:hypothetical protein
METVSLRRAGARRLRDSEVPGELPMRGGRGPRRRPRGFGYDGEGASDEPGPPISETRALKMRTGKRPHATDRDGARARWGVLGRRE